MIRILAFDPTLPGPTTISSDGLEVVVERFAQRLVARASESFFNLLALCNLPADQASRIAGRVQRVPRWQMIPVLYVVSAGTPGIILPASYRFHLDGLAVGRLKSKGVLDAMRDHALPAVDQLPPASFGLYQLDRASRVLSYREAELQLSARESEVLAILLTQGNAAISAEELASRMQNGVAGEKVTIDVARKVVSRLRSKLAGSDSGPRIVNQRGVGYTVAQAPEGPVASRLPENRAPRR